MTPGRAMEGTPARLARDGSCSGLIEAFRALHQEGLGVLDVGSRGGVHAMLQGMAPLLEVVGFEPDQHEWQRLQADVRRSARFRSLAYLPYALGAADGARTLYMNRLGGTSSLYQPNRQFLNRFPDAERFDLMATVSVPVRSLDSLRRDGSLPQPRVVDFIKIDTQGSALDILRGARQTLCREVIGIEVEVEFTRLYDAQPLFRDVDAFLAECGFTLFKLRRQEWVRRPSAARPHHSAGQLVFADALYLRDPLDASFAWVPQDARQVEALVLIATWYDLHDFALELLSRPDLPAGMQTARMSRYVTQRSRRLGSFVERLRVVRAAFSGSERLRRYAACWTRGDDDFYSSLGS